MISVFEVDEKTGGLTRIQSLELRDAGPRGCAFSPDEKYLFLANLEVGNISALAIGDDGRLSYDGVKLNQPFPGTVTFVRV